LFSAGEDVPGVPPSTSQTEQAPPLSPSPPAKAAPPAPGVRDDGIGNLVPVHDSSGATANIVLNGVRYAPVLGDSMGAQLIVLDVTIEGTSATAYRYTESDFQFAYLGNNETDPAYAHTIDKLSWGASPGEDHRPFMPPAPLRIGSVSLGQQVHGLVILRAGSRGPYVAFVGSLKPADRMAQWQLADPHK
jgi:hypothetical protein